MPEKDPGNAQPEDWTAELSEEELRQLLLTIEGGEIDGDTRASDRG